MTDVRSPEVRWPSFDKVRRDYGVDPFHVARHQWEWGFTEDGRLWLLSNADAYPHVNYDGSVPALDGRGRKHFFRPVDEESAA